MKTVLNLPLTLFDENALTQSVYTGALMSFLLFISFLRRSVYIGASTSFLEKKAHTAEQLYKFAKLADKFTLSEATRAAAIILCALTPSDPNNLNLAVCLSGDSVVEQDFFWRGLVDFAKVSQGQFILLCIMT